MPAARRLEAAVGDIEQDLGGGAGQGAIGVEAGGDGDLVQGLAEDLQGRGVVGDGIARRELGAARFPRRPGGRQARAGGDAAHELVPILAQAGLDLDVVARTPVVEYIRRKIQVGPAVLAAALEHRLRQQLSVRAELLIAGAPEIGIVIQTVEADPGLDLVHPGGLSRFQGQEFRLHFFFRHLRLNRLGDLIHLHTQAVCHHGHGFR